MYVVTGRSAGDHKDTFFDLDWQRLPIAHPLYPPAQEQIEKPKKLEEIIAFAELLAKSIPFARMDFYEAGDKVYFGEITLYPDDGHANFSPDEWNYTLGEWITLPVQQAAGSR